MELTALQAAGILSIFAAVGHGFLGDQNIRAMHIEPAATKNFLRCCYQFGSAGWLAAGVLLLASDAMSSDGQQWLAIATVPLFAFGALVNLWFTRGRHPGWVMLGAVAGLSVVGVT